MANQGGVILGSPIGSVANGISFAAALQSSSHPALASSLSSLSLPVPSPSTAPAPAAPSSTPQIVQPVDDLLAALPPSLAELSSSSSSTPAAAASPSSESSASSSSTSSAASAGPTNPLVDAMLTDLYQITMAYGLFFADRHEDDSVFELFFRKPPFGGEFTIFCGLEECVRFISTFRFSASDVLLLSKKFPTWNPSFWSWLASIDCKRVKLYAIEEGSVVFPREPLLRVEGPLAICQLLETTLLTLVNFPSLVATNAARFRLAAGPTKSLIEFGLRRAQGPDGALSASRYCYIGGFDGTSNVRAGFMFGLPVAGTHAHAFVSSFTGMSDLKTTTITDSKGATVEFVDQVVKYRAKLKRTTTNMGELTAFTAYAQAFPTGFLALVDTYDTLESGVWNFLAVALALNACGYKAIGLRLDSGDLAYLSKECRRAFREVSDSCQVDFTSLQIVASNDLSEKVLWSLREQGHEIDCFGVGTNLVTCKGQPALGCVYKLVEVRGKPRMKISQDVTKVTIPGKKEVYRLYNAVNEPLLDLMVSVGGPVPTPTKRILCMHPFDSNKRAYVTPTRVEALHVCVWDGKVTRGYPSIHDLRRRVASQLASFREDHLRRVNPTPFKISLNADLHQFMHLLWQQEMPIVELS